MPPSYRSRKKSSAQRRRPKEFRPVAFFKTLLIFFIGTALGTAGGFFYSEWKQKTAPQVEAEARIATNDEWELVRSFAGSMVSGDPDAAQSHLEILNQRLDGLDALDFAGAQVELARGMPDLAKDRLDDAIRKNSRAVDALLERGRQSLKTSEFSKAADDFEAAIRRDAFRAESHFYHANAMAALRKPNDARNSFRTALGLNREPSQVVLYQTAYLLSVPVEGMTDEEAGAQFLPVVQKIREAMKLASERNADGAAAILQPLLPELGSDVSARLMQAPIFESVKIRIEQPMNSES